MKQIYTIRTTVFRYAGQAGSWYFVSIPKTVSTDIKTQYKKKSRNWGSLPVKVTIRTTTWQTSIFPDTKSGTYLLPLKADIRKKEQLDHGDTISLRIQLMVS